MGKKASQITSLTTVCSHMYSGADRRKHQSSVSLASVRGIHRSPVNFPHKRPVTWECFHLMTSSCTLVYLFQFYEVVTRYNRVNFFQASHNRGKIRSVERVYVLQLWMSSDISIAHHKYTIIRFEFRAYCLATIRIHFLNSSYINLLFK